jgi:hypothetical protein
MKLADPSRASQIAGIWHEPNQIKDCINKNRVAGIATLTKKLKLKPIIHELSITNNQ